MCGSERDTAVATPRQQTLEHWSREGHKTDRCANRCKNAENRWGSRVIPGVALQQFASASTDKMVTLAVCQ
jgi:hypothetical protein